MFGLDLNVMRAVSMLEFTIYEKWKYFMDKGDYRTKNWPTMSSPFPAIIFGFAYIHFVTVLGPRLMKNRKPINVGNLQMFHNVFHLLTNIWFIYQATYAVERAYLRRDGISFLCEPFDNSSSERSMKIAELCWYFYISKYSDCFETILFVLRKRAHLVNYYHVFHHSIMPFTIWWTVKYWPNGHATFFGFINPIVHVVYYSYYITKQIYPRIKEVFWWFRTFSIIFQVGQFVLLILHAMQLVFRNPCNYPMGYSYFVMSITTLFYLIFMYQYKWRKCANQSMMLR